MRPAQRIIRRRQQLSAAVGLAFTLGLVLTLLFAYRAATAGGLGASSYRLVCMNAARAEGNSHPSDAVRIDRRYLPPSATCLWSDGDRTALVRSGPWSWLGPVLMVGSLGTLAVAAVRRRTGPRSG